MAEARPLLLKSVIGAALVVLAAVPFAQTLWHGFLVYDDNLYVTENPIVQQGLTLKGIGWAFTAFDASNWHPLTWLSHMLDCTMFRRADGTIWAGGHHLMNVALHCVNTLLVWVVLRELTGALWRSALVAALFAVHPLHVESVAWIAERKDVLSTCFGLLSIGWYERWARRRSLAAYGCMAAAFAMSLLAKPMLVTLPFLLLLLDMWPLRRVRIPGFGTEHSRAPSPNGERKKKMGKDSPAAALPRIQQTSWSRILAEKIPLLAMSAASCIMTMLAQHSGGAVYSLGDLPAGARVGIAAVAYATYLLRTIWPLDLALFYPLPAGGYWPAWIVAASLLVLAAVTVLAIVLRRSRPHLLIGWLWYLGTLVPVIGLVQVGMQSMADRYTYVPLIGLFIMIAWSLPASSAAARGTSLAISAVMLTCFTVLTVIQVRYWHDDVALFSRSLSVTKDNYIAHSNLGHALTKADQLDAAIDEFNKAIAIRSDFAPAQANLGNVLMRTGQAAQAIPHFEAAFKKSPGSYRLVASLGAALVMTGRLDEAVAMYRRALESSPGVAEIHASLAAVLAQTKRADEAVVEYRQALQLNPNDATIHANYGVALGALGRLDEAIAQFQEALRLQPESEQAEQYLRMARQQKDAQGSH